VVDADSGKVVAIPPICDGPGRRRLRSQFELFLRVLWRRQPNRHHEDSADKYTVVENVPTKKTARTMGFDPKRTRSFSHRRVRTTSPGERRGKMKPGTFAILVVSK